MRWPSSKRSRKTRSIFIGGDRGCGCALGELAGELGRISVGSVASWPLPLGHDAALPKRLEAFLGQVLLQRLVAVPVALGRGDRGDDTELKDGWRGGPERGALRLGLLGLGVLGLLRRRALEVRLRALWFGLSRRPVSDLLALRLRRERRGMPLEQLGSLALQVLMCPSDQAPRLGELEEARCQAFGLLDEPGCCIPGSLPGGQCLLVRLSRQGVEQPLGHRRLGLGDRLVGPVAPFLTLLRLQQHPLDPKITLADQLPHAGTHRRPLMRTQSIRWVLCLLVLLTISLRAGISSTPLNDVDIDRRISSVSASITLCRSIRAWCSATTWRFRSPSRLGTPSRSSAVTSGPRCTVGSRSIPWSLRLRRSMRCALVGLLEVPVGGDLPELADFLDLAGAVARPRLFRLVSESSISALSPKPSRPSLRVLVRTWAW